MYNDIAQKQTARGRRAKSVINMSLGGLKNEIQTTMEILMLDLGQNLSIKFRTMKHSKLTNNVDFFKLIVNWLNGQLLMW